jgi:DNA-binding NarL/FixJ family response regulator
MPVRLLLADDHAVFREGMAALLQRSEKIELVDLATDGHDLLDKLEQHRPDVVVTDLTMPGPGAKAMLTEIAARAPGTRIIVLTMHNEPAIAASVMELGVDGYVVKEDAFAQVVDAIAAVTRGKRYLSPSIAAELLTSHPPHAATVQLTPRELAVLRGIAAGDTNRRMAATLRISVKTVETHRAKLMRKLDVRSAPELIRVAMERGYLAGGERLP